MDYTILTIIGACVSILTGWYKIQGYHSKQTQDKINNVKEDLEEKIKSNKELFDNEIKFLKEVNTNEIKNLEKKIDQLKDSFNDGQKQLLELIHRLVDKND